MRIADFTQRLAHLLEKSVLKNSLYLLRAEFDSGKLAAFKLVMPHAHIVKAEIAQNIFGALDHAQLLRRNGLTIRDSRTQASHLRFLSSWQADSRRQFAYLGFRETSLFERRADLKFRCGLRAGPEVANVAGVLAIGYDGKAFFDRKRRKLRKQLMLAEIAAVLWVREIFRIGKLIGFNHPQWDAELLCDSNSVFQ